MVLVPKYWLRNICWSRMLNFGKRTTDLSRNIAGVSGIILRLVGSLLFSILLPARGIGDFQSTTQSISVNVSPNGKLSLPASIDLRSATRRFDTLSGTLTLSYWARTSDSGGGAVTVQANSDFTPAGGPSINAVSITCSGATLGAGCSGIQTLSTATQTSLVTLPGGACTGGGGACSAQEPNTVLLRFSVPSKAQYKTGNYSSQLTFTISSM